MATISTFKTLVELTTTEVDDAALRLGRAMRVVEESRQKLVLLQSYRDDYVQRFQSTMAAGFTPMGYRNYQSFMVKLDQAISGQEVVITDAERRAEFERAAWREAERKRTSYRTLETRAQKTEDKKIAKRDQKETDEFAARRLHYTR